MKFLKNYTSNVPSSITLGRIEALLVRCGVKGITKEFGVAGQVLAIMFHLDEGDGRVATVRLPAKVKEAQEALWANYVNGDSLSTDGNEVWSNAYKKKRRQDFLEQGERTAWKIVQDWVEVQMSMIAMNQADRLEVFMPYLWDGKRTCYQALREQGFAGLLPEKTGE